MTGARQYSTFHADRFHFAMDVDHVQEVLQPMPTTPVPLTTDLVDGLVNLRGQIITAIDLRTRLGLARRHEDEWSVSLIVRTGGGLVSLRADRLGDVLDLDALASDGGRRVAARADDVGDAPGTVADRSELEPLPDTVQGPVREVACGIISLADSLLVVLDPDRLLTAAVGLQSSDED